MWVTRLSKFQRIEWQLFWLFTFICAVGASRPDLHLLDATVTNADGSPKGWSLMVKEGKPRLHSLDDGGRHGICLDALNSSFSINRQVNVDLRKVPRLHWSWRAEMLPPRGDFRESDTDDQAAQLFVAFERSGILAPTAINYIWDTNAPEAAVGNYSIPFVINVKTVVVTSGESSVGSWIAMERDVAGDYKRLFKDDPPLVSAIRFQVNSQHTRSRAEGCIAEIVFTEL
jgi:hypothetical protein